MALVLLLTPVLLVTSWYLAPFQTEILSGTGTGSNTSPSAQFQLLSILQQLVMVPVIASIAVAWHRLILNREHPSGAYLRFDRSVWLYAAFLLAVELLTQGLFKSRRRGARACPCGAIRSHSRRSSPWRSSSPPVACAAAHRPGPDRHRPG